MCRRNKVARELIILEAELWEYGGSLHYSLYSDMALKCLRIKTLGVLGYIFKKVKKPAQPLTTLNRNPNKTGKYKHTKKVFVILRPKINC